MAERGATGWYGDPFGRFDKRFFDGDEWTERVQSGSNRGIDPPGIERLPFREETPHPVAPIMDAPLPFFGYSRRVRAVMALAVVVCAGLLVLSVWSALTA